MDSANGTAYMANPRTVTVTDEGQGYEDTWQLKPMDVQHLGEPPETMREIPMILIPIPIIDQLVYVAGPEKHFPLCGYLAACKPFLVAHDVWIDGEMAASQRLHRIQVRAIELLTGHMDMTYRKKIVSMAAKLALDRSDFFHWRDRDISQADEATDMFCLLHDSWQLLRLRSGQDVLPCPFRDGCDSDEEQDYEDQTQLDAQERQQEFQEQEFERSSTTSEELGDDAANDRRYDADDQLYGDDENYVDRHHEFEQRYYEEAPEG